MVRALDSTNTVVRLTTNPIRRTAAFSSRLVERFLPDAFLFAILLTFVAYGRAYVAVEPTDGAITHARQLPVDGWYGGFWALPPSPCR